jgi:hypothetical protein
MGGDSEYEPRDSRNITGEADTPDGHFTGDRQKPGHGGEYEPRDSRNVTGTASTPDGRWTNVDGLPPMADESREEPQPDEGEESDDDEPVDFDPDPELIDLIANAKTDS